MCYDPFYKSNSCEKQNIIGFFQNNQLALDTLKDSQQFKSTAIKIHYFGYYNIEIYYSKKSDKLLYPKTTL